MSRWRPPGPRASPYITESGYGQLKREYQELWGVRRPAVVRALADAAAEGDRSENAEYIYRKKELREIDRRVRYLQQRLPLLKVVSSRPDDTGKVYFGAQVRYRDEQGVERRVRIVGADEASSGAGLVSVDSPLARTLLGKSLGDELMLVLPAGEQQITILTVNYDCPETE